MSRPGKKLVPVSQEGKKKDKERERDAQQQRQGITAVASAAISGETLVPPSTVSSRESRAAIRTRPTTRVTVSDRKAEEGNSASTRGTERGDTRVGSTERAGSVPTDASVTDASVIAAAATTDAVSSFNRAASESNIDVPATSSFSQIMQGWETYLGEGARHVQLRSPTEALQAPLQQMFQNLSLCGVGAMEAPGIEGEEGSFQQASSSRQYPPMPWEANSTHQEQTELFERIIPRHTHSSPLQYRSTRTLDQEDVPSIVGRQPMRRSSSNPSTSAFRHSSAGSAFGRHAHRMAGLSGQDSAHRSAFSLPMQRRSFAANSDSGIHYSAFDPVASAPKQVTPDAKSATPVPTKSGADEGSSVAAASEQGSTKEDSTRAGGKPPASQKTAQASSAPSAASSRASRFFSDVKALRRRKRRSGRENPARPPSSSSSSRGEEDTSKGSKEVAGAQHADLEPSSSLEEGSSSVDASSNDVRATGTGRLSRSGGEPRDPVELSCSNDSSDNEEQDNDGATGNDVPDERRYHRLGSEDIDDEETQHEPEGIETTSILRRPSSSLSHHPHLLPTHAESPPIPSPTYHQFVDDHDEHPLLPQGGEVVGGRSFPRDPRGGPQTVVPSSSASTKTPTTPKHALIVRHDNDEGSNLTPGSQDSATHFSRATTRSTITSNTSGHTTHATSTSATTSSGQITVTSSVAEADREVMEANRRERLRRRQQLQLASRPSSGVSPDMDGTASLHSSSTTSTNTQGYLALASSPAPLRDGASLPVERFFSGSSIPISHSSSSNTNSTPSTQTASSGGSNAPQLPVVASRKPKSPHTVSSSSQANTTSSGSTGEEPPRFVSYLDRQTSATALHVKADAPPVRGVAGSGAASTSKLATAANRHSGVQRTESGDADEERESPAEMVGYSRLVFEEAKSGIGGEAGELPSLAAGRQHPKPIRPTRKRDKVKRRWTKLRSKPPRSPVKPIMGSTSSRTPTSTPPPAPQSSGTVASSSGMSPGASSSPAYYQISPPHIIDPQSPYGIQQIRPVGVSRPHVLRSSGSGGGQQQGKMILVSPPSQQSGEGDAHHAAVLSSPIPGRLTVVGGGADEGAQEVFSASKPPPSFAVVSPDEHPKKEGSLVTRPVGSKLRVPSHQETIFETEGEETTTGAGFDDVKKQLGKGAASAAVGGASKAATRGTAGKKMTTTTEIKKAKKGATVTPDKGSSTLVPTRKQAKSSS